MRLLAGLLTSLILLLACAAVVQAQTPLEPLSTDARLQVAIMDFPGYSEVDENGHAVGRTVTLVEKLLQQAGLAYEIRILPAARIWKGLEDGSVQIWPGIVNKPGLEAHTLLTRRTLGTVGINLYYPPGTRPPAWPQGVKGKRLILITNYTYTAQLMRTLSDPALNLTFHSGSSHLGAVRMLLRGRGDYLLDYRAQVDTVVDSLGIEALPHITVAEQSMRLVVSRRTPDATRLVQALDLAYDQLLARGVELDVTRQ
ncbi:MAG: transporter substrate-binding domain-containing protein [Halopseudomonas sp.]|uniref:substrate-binding periplasmic protein n=1 Tax=Halopseudomonas sp. TaxID=2901191 RepID=UPI0030034A7C